MNGRRYLLDTNAIIQLLAHNPHLEAIVADAGFIATSVICQMEFLSFPHLSANDKNLFLSFISRVTVYDVMANDTALTRETVSMRTSFGLKLPDAIIAATALVNNCEVVSADGHFRKQDRVSVNTYQPL